MEPYALQCQPLRVKYGDLTDAVCAFPHPLSLILCTRISISLKTSINEKFGGLCFPLHSFHSLPNASFLTSVVQAVQDQSMQQVKLQ